MGNLAGGRGVMVFSRLAERFTRGRTHSKSKDRFFKETRLALPVRTGGNLTVPDQWIQAV